MKKYIVIFVIILLVGALLLGACSSPTATEPTTSEPTTSEPTTSEPKPPIKIGLLAPLTSFAADIGLENKIGTELALEECNYQIAGRDVELIVEDTAVDPAIAVTKARKLLEQDGVHVIIGPYLEHTRIAVSAYLEESGWIPQISPGGGTVEGMLPYPHVIGAYMTEEMCTVPFARYAYDTLDLKRAIVVGSEYAWGEGCLNAFSKGFEEAGGTIVDSFSVPVNTMDMGPYINKIKEQEDNADFVFDFVIASDNIRFHRQFAEEGLEIQRLSSSEGICVDHWVTQTGPAAIGAYGFMLWVYQTGESNPAAKKFDDAYFNKTGKTADYYSVVNFMSVKMIEYALQAIDGDAEDREAFMDALIGVRIPADDNVYRLGDLTVDSVYREPILDGYVLMVEDNGGQPAITIIDTVKNVNPKLLK